MSAPRFNVNAIRNGTHLAKRLVIGELPDQLRSVKREGRAYRRAMESEVLAVRGEVGLTEAHLIDTATAAMIHCGICRWLLREKIGTMEATDILRCSEAMLRAKETRDRAVRALKLDTRQDAIDALYSIPEPADCPTAIVQAHPTPIDSGDGDTATDTTSGQTGPQNDSQSVP